MFLAVVVVEETNSLKVLLLWLRIDPATPFSCDLFEGTDSEVFSSVDKSASYLRVNWKVAIQLWLCEVLVKMTPFLIVCSSCSTEVEICLNM